MNNIEIPILNNFLFLLKEKVRYKILYGGRGSGKSWQIARALITKAYTSNLRILCTREIQRSISDSVHRLIQDQIHLLNLDSFFEIQNNYIKCTHSGSIFLFEGLYRNITKIKSMEGIDICWIEEAESITQDSWDILIPTIRKEYFKTINGKTEKIKSEIWVSFNPKRDDDPTYRMFIDNKRNDAIIKKFNYYDNKYFPDVLKDEMEFMKKENLSKYKHIWLGEPITDYETLVYRWDNQVNCTDKDVKYIQNADVCITFDFGVGDDTAIIFFQVLKVSPCDTNPRGLIIQIFDEYTNNNKEAEHYRDVVVSKGYNIKRYFCDPSGSSRDSSLKSWIDKLSYNKNKGRNDWNFEYTYAYSPTEMIDHANDYIRYVQYNPHTTPNVHNMFRNWKYRTDKFDKIILPAKAEHDEFSHFGTAWYYGMINYFSATLKKAQAVLK